jgi:hypothetical protein
VSRGLFVVAECCVGLIHGQNLEVVGGLFVWVPHADLDLVGWKARNLSRGALDSELILDDVTGTLRDFEGAAAGTEKVGPELGIFLAWFRSNDTVDDDPSASNLLVCPLESSTKPAMPIWTLVVPAGLL